MNVRLLHYQIKPGQRDAYLKLFRDLQERVAGMEGLAFFNIFQDLEDPNTLFLAAVFEDELDMDKYAEIGPNQAYSDAVAPLIESFDLAMSYEVSKATALYS